MTDFLPLTDEELAALTDLANLAEPYTAEKQETGMNENPGRTHDNADFFEAAYRDVPRLIAEVDATRLAVTVMLEQTQRINRLVADVDEQNKQLHAGRDWLDEILAADLIGVQPLSRVVHEARAWREAVKRGQEARDGG